MMWGNMPRYPALPPSSAYEEHRVVYSKNPMPTIKAPMVHRFPLRRLVMLETFNFEICEIGKQKDHTPKMLQGP